MPGDMTIYCTTVEENIYKRKLKLVFTIMANKDMESSATSTEYKVCSNIPVLFKFHYLCCKVNLTYKIATSVSLNRYSSLQKHSNTEIQVTCNVNGVVKQSVCQQCSEFFYIQMYNIRDYINSSLVFDIPIEITVDRIPIYKSIPSPWSILHSEDSFTDFHLSSESGTVPVHRVVMAHHSDVFKTMLNGEWKETAKHCLEVEGVTQKTLQHLKDYMYLGSLPEHEDLRPLLLIAKCYMMQQLEEACSDKLARSVTPEKYQDTLEFAVDNRLLSLISSMGKNVSAKVVQDAEDLANQKLKAKK